MCFQKSYFMTEQHLQINISFHLKYIYPNNSRDVYLYIYSVSAYMG